MANVLRAPIVIKIQPKSSLVAVNTNGEGPSRLLNLLASKDVLPFGVRMDAPNPRGYIYPTDNRTFVDPSEYWLLKDAFFGVAGNPNKDQPNPRVAPFPIEGRTFTDPSEYWILTDKFFGLAGNPTTDFPNPRGYAFPVEGRNFINPMESQLIGKDQFFGAPGERTPVDQPNPMIARQPRQDYILNLLQSTLGIAPPRPFVQSDWVNPRIPQPQPGLYTIAGRPVYITPTTVPFLVPDQPNPRVLASRPDIYSITGGSILTPPVVAQSPFSQDEWPNPIRAQFPVSNRTLIAYYVLDESMPFVTTDWPNPIIKAYGIDLRTFLNAMEGQLIGKDQFFGAPGERTPVDQPNPVRVTSPYHSYTWLMSLLESTLSIPLLFPFSQDEWPNPITKKPDVSLRTFLDPTKVNLIGQDQMFGAPGQVMQYEFPNPLSAKQQRDLRATMVNLLENTLGIIVPSPFVMLDWPNPIGRTPPIDVRTFLGQLPMNLLGKDQFFGAAGQPPANYDQPNPRVASYPVVCRVHIGPVNPNLIGIDTPMMNYDQPNPLMPTFPMAGRSITQSRTDLLGKDTFFGVGGPRYDYPNPQIARQPIVLKTFLDPTKIQLIGKDKFFGGAGQAPANYDQPNPGRYRQPVDLKWLFNNLLEGTLGISARTFNVAFIDNEYYLVTDITMDSYTLTGIDTDTDVESQ